MSLEERVKIPGEANYQTKFLLGAQGFEERGLTLGSKELNTAKKIIAEDFSFVGLAEQFDESLILMKEILNLDDLNINYEKMHVTQRKHITKDKISQNLLEEISEANKIDYELYCFVRDKLFEKQKQKYKSDFIRVVNNFKQTNINYKFKKSKILKYRLGKYLVYRPMFKLASYFS